MAILSPLKDGLCDPFISLFMHTLQARVVLLTRPAVKQCHIHSAAADLTRDRCKLKRHSFHSKEGNSEKDVAAKLLLQFVFPSFCNVITNMEAYHLIFGLQPLASMQSFTYFTF